MTLSSKQIGDIANLYESITASGQEQLSEGPYNADSVRAAQEAARKGEQERSNKEKAKNVAVQAARTKEANAAPAGSSPRQMQQAAVQGMLDRQKARGGPNNGWNKDNLTKAINPKYTPQNVARAQQAVGIKPAITPTPTSRQPVAAPTRPAASAPTPAKVLPSKPVGSAMDQWRAANPKLAAAADEKARIRGTQQTDNPLMKDMRSRLPMNSPSVQAPSVAKLGAGNQSLVNNPNAFKAAPEVKKTAAIAATPKPAPVAPVKTQIAAGYEYEDAYDLVLEYLFDNGHVDTVDEAHYIMMELDAEFIQDIVEETLTEKLAKGTKGVSFSTGRHQGGFDQAMTERNPSTGRQRKTSPMYKAMGAHSKAKAAQWEAERKGDTESARRHETRRNKIANTVYNKTNRIIDRADND